MTPKLSTSRESAISIVIPTYNVEAFIGPCIASLQAQTFADFDVVIVNDGSTDNSADVARRLTSDDDRFIVIDQDNRGPGPGGGRNGGLAHTRSDRLLFMDSDDGLTPDAVGALVLAFEDEPDLDIATTSAARMIGATVRPSHFHDISHPHPEACTHVRRSPWLTFDSTPWNKAFRREFFDRVVGTWPEQQLYEDIVPMTRAILAAERIAVLTDRHYLWRSRGEGSITGPQTQVRGDLAQLDQLGVAREFVIATENDELVRWFDWKSLTQDMLWMTRKLTTLEAEPRAQLHGAMRNSLLQIEPALIAATRPPLRRCYDAIIKNTGKTTATIVANRLALIQDRRPPGQALGEDDQAVSLLRTTADNDGLTMVLASKTIDLRRATLRLRTAPPWSTQVDRAATVEISPASARSSFARFHIATALVEPDSATPADYYVEVVERGGPATEITRSLIDAARRRIAGEAKPSNSPLQAYFDDGRVRISSGAAQPAITAAELVGGDLELRGGVPAGWTDEARTACFTQSWPRIVLEGTFELTSSTDFLIRLDAGSLDRLAGHPFVISLLPATNPAIPEPVGVLQTVSVPLDAAVLRIAPGPFGEGYVQRVGNPSRRAVALLREVQSLAPPSLGGTGT